MTNSFAMPSARKAASKDTMRMSMSLYNRGGG
jgi:hypothetical protein